MKAPAPREAARELIKGETLMGRMLAPSMREGFVLGSAWQEGVEAAARSLDRQKLAEAWDQGWDEGRDYAETNGIEGNPNPYREQP